MSWNGSGTFNRTYSWVADRNAGLNISASRMDTDTNDITSNGFANCVTRDGQGAASANQPMASFRHTGVGAAAARTDYARLDQLQDGVSINWTTAGGTADALTATYTPALTALVDGQICFVRAASANATTTPTFAPNGLTARTITKSGGSALVAGEIAANAELILRYNLTITRWELLNPAPTIAAGGIVAPGTVLDYAGSSAPTGYLLCNGAAVSRTTFAALFAILGTTYGAGDGSTTFALPDATGRAIFGKESAASRVTTAGSGIDGATLGASGGAQNVTVAQANLPAGVTLTTTIGAGQGNHGHPVRGAQQTTGGGFVSFASLSNADNDAGANGAVNATLPAMSGTTPLGGSGTALNKMPPALILNKIIKT